MKNRKNEQVLSAQQLHHLFSYNADTGVLYWKNPNARCLHPGDVAGGVIIHGYVRVKVLGYSYGVHRIAFAMSYGRWPSACIDHIDGVRNNNRLSNLREAFVAENNQNIRLYASNTSGYVGVSWHKSAGKWRARIHVKKKCVELGKFDSAEEAAEAYRLAKLDIHKFQPALRDSN